MMDAADRMLELSRILTSVDGVKYVAIMNLYLKCNCAREKKLKKELSVDYISVKMTVYIIC